MWLPCGSHTRSSPSEHRSWKIELQRNFHPHGRKARDNSFCEIQCASYRHCSASGRFPTMVEMLCVACTRSRCRTGPGGLCQLCVPSSCNGFEEQSESSKDLIEADIKVGSASHGRACLRSLARGASRSTKTKVERANDLS